MHTVRDVATLAGKKLGLIRSGGELKAADAADMAASLQSFYMDGISSGMFGKVGNVQISQGSDITAGTNQHINVLTEDAVTIDLPASLPYGCWESWRPCRDYGWGLNIPVGADQNVRVPRDLSVVMVTDQYGDSRATYLYDGTIQRWLRIDTLGLNDEAPLSARNYDGLASLLAVRTVDLFGDNLLSPATVRAGNRYQIALVSRHGVDDDCYC